MASSLGIHLLPICVLLSFFVLGQCSETLDPNGSVFDANNVLEMVTEAPVFTHYFLSFYWAPSICTEEKATKTCVGPVPTDFTLHGFWPTTNKRPFPRNCNSSDVFDPKNVESLRGELEAKWPSLYGDNEGFWAYEWQNHGTCSGLTQYDYFKTTLELLKDPKVKVLKNLEAIGVLPGTDTTYNPISMVAKYNNKFEIKPRIRCVKKTSNPLVEQIAEIRFKVNKDGKTVETMTGGTIECQTKKLVFPL